MNEYDYIQYQYSLHITQQRIKSNGPNIDPCGTPFSIVK